MKPNIVVLDGFTLNPGDLSWQPLQDLGNVTLYDRTPNELIVERANDADLILTNKTPLSTETLKQLPKLKYVGILATGMNVIDLDFAESRGITVTNIPAYSTPSVAQLTFALLLEHCHHIADHAKSVQQGNWQKCNDFCYQLTNLIELKDKVFGIFGFGTIGQQCAKIAEAFGMKVIFYNRSVKKPSDFPLYQQVDKETLFKSADVISLNCPLTPETKQLINSETLSLMKPSSILINTGRGPLIDEAALAEALQNNQIAGYGADVLSTEPPTPDNPLLTAPNTFITPHIAWKTKEARQRLMDIAVQNVKDYLAKEDN